MSELLPNYSIQPGDGTGTSLADSYIRNEKGECFYCLNKATETYGLRKVCNKCNKRLKNLFLKTRHSDDITILNLIREVLNHD